MGVCFFVMRQGRSTDGGWWTETLFSPGEICYVTDNVSVSNICDSRHIADYVRITKFPLGKIFFCTYPPFPAMVLGRREMLKAYGRVASACLDR